MTLYDNISIRRVVYSDHYRIYDRASPYKCQVFPKHKVKIYTLTKLWNSDRNKAEKLYKLLAKSHRYDKVKLHKGCVYASRRIN